MGKWRIGDSGEARRDVTEANTAEAVKSGSLPVLATPCLVALMEEAAVHAIAPAMDEGFTSVGIRIDVAHEAATPIGGTVVAKATLTDIQGRKLTFAIAAHDAAGQVGHAVHERFVVEQGRFMGKVNARASGELPS